MNRIIDKYQKCLRTCRCPQDANKPPTCLCTYVCQDKFRQDLGDYAMKTGENLLWNGKPVQWANMNPQRTLTPKYIAVQDMDNESRGQSCYSPFTTPSRYVPAGCEGAQNRAYPYGFVYRNGYGGLMKCTKPSSKGGPIYY